MTYGYPLAGPLSSVGHWALGRNPDGEIGRVQSHQSLALPHHLDTSCFLSAAWIDSIRPAPEPELDALPTENEKLNDIETMLIRRRMSLSFRYPGHF